MVYRINRLDLFVFLVRFLVGALFIFSGFIKINDPLGFSYKLEEYFQVFGMESLSFLSLFLSIFFCTLEIILGFAVLIGFRTRLVVLGILGLILFFTFLTFYSAYFNKVTECGCFGDAIKLTPWQSFYKNIFLTSLILILFFFQDRISPLFKLSVSNIWMTFILFLTLGFGLYSYWYLPLLDFLPYKVGNYLPSFMEIPKGMSGDEFGVIYTLKNSKTGEIKKINDKDYIRTKIYENHDWIFMKASDPILIKPGYQAPAKDFMVTDSTGADRTKDILNYPGYTLLVIEYNLKSVNTFSQIKFNTLAHKLSARKVEMMGLTSTTVKEATDVLKPFHPNYPIYYCDEVPLKSMVRSNPGLVLLKKGTVVAKWSRNNIPDFEDLFLKYLSKP